MRKDFGIRVREGLQKPVSSISDVYTQEVDNNGLHQSLPYSGVAASVRSVAPVRSPAVQGAVSVLFGWSVLPVTVFLCFRWLVVLLLPAPRAVRRCLRAAASSACKPAVRGAVPSVCSQSS